MKLQELLERLREFSDKELERVAHAAEFELQERAYRKQEFLEPLGLVPLYRCQKPEHQAYGLFAEDPDRPGILFCGCPKSQAQLVSYE